VTLQAPFGYHCIFSVGALRFEVKHFFFLSFFLYLFLFSFFLSLFFFISVPLFLSGCLSWLFYFYVSSLVFDFSLFIYFPFPFFKIWFKISYAMQFCEFMFFEAVKCFCPNYIELQSV